MEDLGNPHASKWIEYSMSELCTSEGVQLARAILKTDSTSWWIRRFESVDSQEISETTFGPVEK